LSVGVNPAGLSAGTYSGVIVIASQSVAVTLTIATAAPPANVMHSRLVMLCPSVSECAGRYLAALVLPL